MLLKKSLYSYSYRLIDRLRPITNWNVLIKVFTLTRGCFTVNVHHCLGIRFTHDINIAGHQALCVLVEIIGRIGLADAVLRCRIPVPNSVKFGTSEIPFLISSAKISDPLTRLNKHFIISSRCREVQMPWCWVAKTA